MTRSVDELARIVVDTAYHMHADLGPGLLETAYEIILCEKLIMAGLSVDRQVAVDIEYSGIRVANAFKIDLLVEQQLLIEVKSVDKFVPSHAKQVLTYLKLADLRVGLLINFGMPTFKEGVKRFANDHKPLAP
jgi:GxxExxY protein